LGFQRVEPSQNRTSKSGDSSPVKGDEINTCTSEANSLPDNYFSLYQRLTIELLRWPARPVKTADTTSLTTTSK
jgi:hypothetical protein